MPAPLAGCQVPGATLMKFTLKMFASLGAFLPPGAMRNAVPVEFDDGSTISQILARLEVPVERVHLVLLNGIYVPPAERARTSLSDGDTLALWPPVAGG